MRYHRYALIPIVLFVGATSIIASCSAERVPTNAVRDVVATTRLAHFESTGNDIHRTVIAYRAHVDSAALAGAIKTHFDPDSLIAQVTQYIRDRADEELFADLYAWFMSDSIRSVEEKATLPFRHQSIAQFEERLQTEPADSERLELAYELERSQHAGFALNAAMTAQQEAMFYIIDGVATDPSPGPWTQEQRARGLDQMVDLERTVALMSLKALTETEALRLINAYDGPSGQWYVLKFVEALEYAFERAARHVVQDVQGTHAQPDTSSISAGKIAHVRAGSESIEYVEGRA